MSYTFVCHISGATCGGCTSQIEATLRDLNPPIVSAISTNEFFTEMTVTTSDEAGSKDVTAKLLKDTINDTGFTCDAVVEETAVTPSAITTPVTASVMTTIAKRKQRRILSHIIKGVIGTVSGAAIIALTLSGFALPLLAMYGLVGLTTVLTLFLGAESYIAAAKKFVKSGKMTMDTLFTVSTLTVVGVSIASVFVPWLPMMLEAGLLIFGFRYIGRAIEDSIKKKVSSGLQFQDRGARTVECFDDKTAVWSTVNSSDLKSGQLIKVKKGSVIPVNGICEDDTELYKTIVTGAVGSSSVIKGEEICAGMKVPEHVEHVLMRVNSTVDQSYLTKLDQRIIKANEEKAPLEEAANKILTYFVPGIIALAAITGIVIGVFFTPALAIQCAVTILVSACPCTLGFITPLAVKIGLAKARENGVQFKSSKTLQEAGDIDTVVFDLNGTLTTGVPVVSDHLISPGIGTEPEDFFSELAAIEKLSVHQIAKVIAGYAAKRSSGKKVVNVTDVDKSHHAGIKAKVNGLSCLVGNRQFLLVNGFSLPPAFADKESDQQIYYVKDGALMGYVNINDPLRKEARFVVNELKRMGKEVHICTGADTEVALRYAKELNIPAANVYANSKAMSVHSGDRSKTDYIDSLKAKKKRVAVVGDAGNDALAIAKSHFGIAVKSPAGDVKTQDEAGALVEPISLLPVVTAFAVAKQTVRSIKQNLVLSLTYNMSTMILVSGVVLAGVVFAVGFALNPAAIGVALMVVQAAIILANQYRIKQQTLPHLKRYEKEESLAKGAAAGSTHRDLYRSGVTPGAGIAVTPGESVTPDPDKVEESREPEFVPVISETHLSSASYCM